MDRFISLSYCLRVTVIVLSITQPTSKVISGRNTIITITQVKARLSVYDISMSFYARQYGLVKLDVKTRQPDLTYVKRLLQEEFSCLKRKKM